MAPAGVVTDAAPSATWMYADGHVCQVFVRHPRQLGQHQQAAIPAAEHALRPPLRWQTAQRGGHLIRHSRWCRFSVRHRSAERVPDRGGLPRPRMTGGGWWWSIAATRRRKVAGAAGHSAEEPEDGVGVGGQIPVPVAAHQSVNSAQSPA